ncbi:hypothetical protein RRG44_00665 [Mycoplasmopsis cynos]|uniref:hypothetical protein n=1 Tax=Mycoplasmopsis cynos TaxID=171284 RepID=UPI002AFE9A9D|nr:hypothetical protein [Mycoplasmopsis cynos]WQQ19331.1 hypothetical protein RRG44_00665 [Mycoplasmopsis cynos]
MKKRAKLFLFSLTGLAALSSVISCNPTKEDDTNPITKRKEKLEKIISTLDLDKAKKTILSNQLKQSKTNQEIEKMQQELNYYVEVKNTKEYLKNSAINNAIIEVMQTKISLAKTEEELSNIKNEIKKEVISELNTLKTSEMYNDISDESKVLIDKMIQDANSVTEKSKIEAKLLEMFNKVAKDKLPTLKQIINDLLKKVTDPTKEKYFSSKNVDNLSYLELKALKLEIEEYLNTKFSEEIYETQKNKFSEVLVIKAIVSILTNENDKKELQKQLENANTNEKLDNLFNNAKSKLDLSTEQLANLKKSLIDVIEKTFNKKNAKNIIDKLNTEIKDFNALYEIIKAAAKLYADEVKKLKDSPELKNSLETLEKNEPKQGLLYKEKVSKASTKEEINNFKNEITMLLNKYRDPEPTNINLFKPSSPLKSTIVPKDAKLRSSEYVINTIRIIRDRVTRALTESTYRIYAKIPETSKTFTLTKDEEKIKAKLIELRNNIIATFFNLSSIVGSNRKDYYFNEVTNSSPTSTKLEISKLLWSVDKALINGLYYESVYNGLLGVEQNKPRLELVHTYYSLKYIIENNKTSPTS